MIRLPQIATHTDTLFPYTTLIRSNPLRPLKTAHLMKGTPPAEAMRRSVGHFSHHLDLLRRIEQMERAHGRLPGRRNDPLRRLFRRSEEHTSELQSLMRISYAVFCLKKNKTTHSHY